MDFTTGTLASTLHVEGQDLQASLARGASQIILCVGVCVSVFFCLMWHHKVRTNSGTTEMTVLSGIGWKICALVGVIRIQPSSRARNLLVYKQQSMLDCVQTGGYCRLGHVRVRKRNLKNLWCRRDSSGSFGLRRAVFAQG